MMVEYSDILLGVLAELRNAFIEGAETREQAIKLLADQVTDPTSVQMAYQEVGDMAAESQRAIELLLKDGGEMVEAEFSRDFGSIRQMGPAKLERETPWLYPESVAEILYYYGLVGRGFKGAGANAHTVIYLPSDIAPWLPHPQNPALADALPVRPLPPPPTSRLLLADDSFLQDMGALLGFLQSERLRITKTGPHPDDVDLLVQRLQLPFDKEDNLLNTRLALLLHLANRIGFLRRGEQETVQLTGNAVRAFLEKTRAEQRLMIWEAWRDSKEWNDLCRTPSLECSADDTWHNDPFQSRAALLTLFAKIQAGNWYSSHDFIRTVKEVEPDFQRPTGDYDSWTIRSSSTQEVLQGFEQWDVVEGALLRFLIQGPLYWLAAVDLAEPSAGDDMIFSLSQWGARAGSVTTCPRPMRRCATLSPWATISRLRWRRCKPLRSFPGRALCPVASQLSRLCLSDQPTQPKACSRKWTCPSTNHRIPEKSYTTATRESRQCLAAIGRGNLNLLS